eukprot:COSAG02_NODE_2507_length_8637_cov_2.877138_3_plen_353_part_00
MANLYPAPVDASMDVATVQADAVLEGKLLRQVDTVRPCRDVGFAILFLICVVGSFIAGSVVVHDVKAAGDALKGCTTFKESLQYKGLHQPPSGGASDVAPAPPIEDSLPAVMGGLGIVAGISVLVSVAYLWSLESHSRCITWSSVCMWPVMTFLLGVYLLINSAQVEAQDKANCTFGNCQMAAYLMMGGAFIFALIVWVRRHNVELTAELLRMSATAFKQNLSLVWTTGLISIGLSWLCISPLGVMSIIAMVPEDIALVYAGCPGCEFGNGSSVTFEDLEKDCHGFLHDDIKPSVAIAVLVSWMVIWVGMLSKEMRIANVGGCIGLHYFEQDIVRAFSPCHVLFRRTGGLSV